MKAAIIRYITVALLLLATVWLVHEPELHPLIVFLGLVIAYVRQDPHFAHVPKLAGRWKYVVRTAGDELSHKGECTIQQSGSSLRIQGTRRLTCTKAGGGGRCQPVNIPWESKWAEICADGKLRFDYHIAIAQAPGGGNIEAICNLNITKKKPVRISGSYYMLPPFDDAVRNCHWGTVTFILISADAELDYTDIGDDEDAEIEA